MFQSFLGDVLRSRSLAACASEADFTLRMIKILPWSWLTFVVHETINLLWPRSKLIGKIIEDSKCFDSTNRIICFAFTFNFNSSNSPFHRQNTWWSFVRWLFESLDGILWCDHSNESSLPVLTHSSIWFSKFHREKFEIWSKFAFR